MSDDTIEVESCWTGEAGARKCLNQALHLVGLNDGPLGDLGVEIMVGEKQKIAKEHKVIAPDCVGLPLKQKISKQHKVATQELHEMRPCLACTRSLRRVTLLPTVGDQELLDGPHGDLQASGR